MSDAPQFVNLARAADGSLVEDDGLETFVTICLFTDAQAGPDDDLPEGDDRRGYWLDAYEDDPSEKTGSKLWLLRRKLLTPQTLIEVEQVCKDALEPAITAGIASRVEVSCTRIADSAGSLTVALYRPNNPNSPYQQTWELHFGLG